MDDRRFAAAVRALTAGRPRRAILGLVFGGLSAPLALIDVAPE